MSDCCYVPFQLITLCSVKEETCLALKSCIMHGTTGHFGSLYGACAVVVLAVLRVEDGDQAATVALLCLSTCWQGSAR
jgi:hypothetical protein